MYVCVLMAAVKKTYFLSMIQSISQAIRARQTNKPMTQRLLLWSLTAWNCTRTTKLWEPSYKALWWYGRPSWRPSLGPLQKRPSSVAYAKVMLCYYLIHLTYYYFEYWLYYVKVRAKLAGQCRSHVVPIRYLMAPMYLPVVFSYWTSCPQRLIYEGINAPFIHSTKS